MSCRKANLAPAVFRSLSKVATAAMLAARLVPVLASCFSAVEWVACTKCQPGVKQPPFTQHEAVGENAILAGVDLSISITSCASTVYSVVRACAAMRQAGSQQLACPCGKVATAE